LKIHLAYYRPLVKGDSVALSRIAVGYIRGPAAFAAAGCIGPEDMLFSQLLAENGGRYEKKGNCTGGGRRIRVSRL
jgi:hypothetical protein